MNRVYYNKPIIKKPFTYLDIRRMKKFFPKANKFVVWGAGSIGKTFGTFKHFDVKYKKQIAKMIKENKVPVINEKFIVLCRTSDEIKDKAQELFKDFENWINIGPRFYVVVEDEFEDENGKLVKEEIKVEAGKMLAINNASRQRGGASYIGYTTFFWDEFIDEQGKWIGGAEGEMTAVKSLIATVFRNRDKHKTQMFFFSNAVASDCPLFRALKIVPSLLKPNSQMYVPKQRLMVWWAQQTDEGIESYKDSDLVELFGEDDAYIQGRIGGKLYVADQDFIERVDTNITKHIYNIQVSGNKLGVYKTGGSIKFKYATVGDKFYGMTPEDAQNLAQQWQSVDGTARSWNTMWQQKRMLFEDTLIQKVITDFLKLYYKK